MIQTLAGEWKEAGVQESDVLLVHSSLKRTFRRYLKLGIKITPQDILESFLSAVGPSGTLLLPLFCSIMRTKYGCYPEYHTSLDDLRLVTPAGLLGGYEVLKKAIECLEFDEVLCSTVLCEPQLGKRGLYPTISTKSSGSQVRDMMNFLAYCDGNLSNLEIAEKINVPLWDIKDTIEKLIKEGVLELAE